MVKTIFANCYDYTYFIPYSRNLTGNLIWQINKYTSKLNSANINSIVGRCGLSCCMRTVLLILWVKRVFQWGFPLCQRKSRSKHKHGVLTGGWNFKANQVVQRIVNKLLKFFLGHVLQQNFYAELPLQYFSPTTDFMYSCVHTDGLKCNFNSLTLIVPTVHAIRTLKIQVQTFKYKSTMM